MKSSGQIKSEIEKRIKKITDACGGVIANQRNSIEYDIYKDILNFIIKD